MGLQVVFPFLSLVCVLRIGVSHRTWKCPRAALLSKVAASHVWLLSTSHVANETEELTFSISLTFN